MASWGVARRRVERLLIGGAVLLTPAVASAQASAATISVDNHCYVSTTAVQAQMTVIGSGFTPGDQVTITSSDGSVDSTVTATATGTIETTTGAPRPAFKHPGEKTVTLTATDLEARSLVATTQLLAAPLSVATKPEQAPLSRKVTWYFSGFRPDKPIFGHYIHHKQVAFARFGHAHGPCGLLKVKARLFPGGHPHFNSYGVQIDDSRRYSKTASPRFVTKLGTFVI